MFWRRFASLGLRPRLSPLARLLVLAIVVAPFVGGCSMFDKDNYGAPDEPAEKLYNEGVFLLNQRSDYKDAAKKFEEVERQHPYSEWARKSLIMSAYANYQARDYDESVTAA